MALENLTQKQKFALSLAAPILVTGSEPNYQCLAFDPVDKVQDMLSSWWGIENREQLLEMLEWLDKEGGHTIEFLRLNNHLAEMLHSERKSFIESLKTIDRDEYTRAQLVEQYLFDLGPYTIKAFDIGRHSMLVRAGYALGWFSEDDTWGLLLEQADAILDREMFSSHFDYLYSYFVGRAFGMKLGYEGVMDSLKNARRLVAEVDSPYLSFAPWPDIGNAVNGGIEGRIKGIVQTKGSR